MICEINRGEKMPVLGVDVGSLSAKAVVWDRGIRGWLVRPTGWSPKQAGWEVVQELLANLGINMAQIDYVVGTGYGRISLDFLQKSITEITCHAQGIHYLFPQARTIIDIGGQDSKVIKVARDGKVLDFLMNDKCAAGTGRFLQVAAQALGLDVSELGQADSSLGEMPISSMCTVFAESEIISLLAQDVPQVKIINGIHKSIAKRIRGMVQRVSEEEKIVFTGGVAKNQALQIVLAKEIGSSLLIPEQPQITGALGAAILAAKQIEKEMR